MSRTVNMWSVIPAAIAGVFSAERAMLFDEVVREERHGDGETMHLSALAEGVREPRVTAVRHADREVRALDIRGADFRFVRVADDCALLCGD